MKKAILIIIVCAVAVLSGWRIYGKIAKSVKRSGGPTAHAAVAVEVSAVEKKTIRSIKKFTGSLVPCSQFLVAPKVAGRLEKLLVNMGDTVKRGQLVAQLDSQEYVQEVEQARAELDVAKAGVAEAGSALETAGKEYERMKVLREKKIVSESELDAAEAAYKTGDARYNVALAQVHQKEAALKAAEVRLSFTQITVSWEGGNDRRIVGERYVDEGEMLRANDPIVSMLEMDSLKALIHLTQEDYSKVMPGQSIVFTTSAYDGREFTGRVVRKSPALRDESRTAGVEVSAPNPSHLLKPGMFITAEVELARRENATVVPVAALTKRDGSHGVFLLDEKEMKVSFISVETGIINTESAEIVHPPLEGRVVTLGQHLVNDGSSVVLPEEKKENPAIPHNSSVSGRIRDEGSRP